MCGIAYILTIVQVLLLFLLDSELTEQITFQALSLRLQALKLSVTLACFTTCDTSACTQHFENTLKNAMSVPTVIILKISASLCTF